MGSNMEVVAKGPRMDEVARAALNSTLLISISRMVEYGGMIYKSGNTFYALAARTQSDPTTVDVGVHEPNHGCPDGTQPVAYYHTHTRNSVGGFKGDYNAFSPEDKDVAKDNDLVSAYLGTLDGSFFRYDVKLNKPVLLHGRLRNTDGKVY
jgi:Domain of unknown function (DUF4329)